MSGGVGLLRLHELVPAAEALDLAEEAAAERARLDWQRSAIGELERLGLGGWGEPTVADRVAEEDASDSDDDPAPSLGQALGLLEAELGARPVDQSASGG